MTRPLRAVLLAAALVLLAGGGAPADENPFAPVTIRITRLEDECTSAFILSEQVNNLQINFLHLELTNRTPRPFNARLRFKGEPTLEKAVTLPAGAVTTVTIPFTGIDGYSLNQLFDRPLEVVDGNGDLLAFAPNAYSVTASVATANRNCDNSKSLICVTSDPAAAIRLLGENFTAAACLEARQFPPFIEQLGFPQGIILDLPLELTPHQITVLRQYATMGGRIYIPDGVPVLESLRDLPLRSIGKLPDYALNEKLSGMFHRGNSPQLWDYIGPSLGTNVSRDWSRRLAGAELTGIILYLLLFLAGGMLGTYIFLTRRKRDLRFYAIFPVIAVVFAILGYAGAPTGRTRRLDLTLLTVQGYDSAFTYAQYLVRAPGWQAVTLPPAGVRFLPSGHSTSEGRDNFVPVKDYTLISQPDGALTLASAAVAPLIRVPFSFISEPELAGRIEYRIEGDQLIVENPFPIELTGGNYASPDAVYALAPAAGTAHFTLRRQATFSDPELPDPNDPGRTASSSSRRRDGPYGDEEEEPLTPALRARLAAAPPETFVTNQPFALGAGREYLLLTYTGTIPGTEFPPVDDADTGTVRKFYLVAGSGEARR